MLATVVAALEEAPAGAIEFRGTGDLTGIAFVCPCGCGRESWLPTDGLSGSWIWNGSKDAATLTPSVRNHWCRWHGHLTNGEWVGC